MCSISSNFAETEDPNSLYYKSYYKGYSRMDLLNIGIAYIPITESKQGVYDYEKVIEKGKEVVDGLLTANKGNEHHNYYSDDLFDIALRQ